MYPVRVLLDRQRQRYLPRVQRFHCVGTRGRLEVAAEARIDKLGAVPKPRQLLLVISILLVCVALIVLGLWLSRPPDDLARGPNAPDGSPATQAFPSNAALPPPPPSGPSSVQMLLGNPSGATEDPVNRDNYLMVKPYFALAYDDSAGEPRWVSWRLCAADLGSAPRKRTFDSDDTLPASFDHVASRDYTGSGFDRGHMCDHSDRASTLSSSYGTFVMTNIVPQAPNNNRKCWAQLENYCRELARAGDRLYISSGPAGRGGVGSKGPADSIAEGRVIVPAQIWKVIVVTRDTGRDDLANVDATDRVIAVDVPNDNDRVGEEWAGFRCAPASIEAKTGLHFFTALPDDVRMALDAKVDSETITPPRPLLHAGPD